MAPDGNYYTSPGYSNSILRIDSEGNAVAIPVSAETGVTYSNMVLGPNGKLYAIPLGAEDHVTELSVLEIDLGVEYPFDVNIPLSPYWNN